MIDVDGHQTRDERVGAQLNTPERHSKTRQCGRSEGRAARRQDSEAHELARGDAMPERFLLDWFLTTAIATPSDAKMVYIERLMAPVHRLH